MSFGKVSAAVVDTVTYIFILAFDSNRFGLQSNLLFTTTRCGEGNAVAATSIL